MDQNKILESKFILWTLILSSPAPSGLCFSFLILLQLLGHQVLHALAFRAGIVATLPFQQVDAAPHAEASAQGNHEGLQDFDRAIEKFHGDLLLTIKSLWPVGYTPEIVDFDKLPTAARADLPVYPGAWGWGK